MSNSNLLKTFENAEYCALYTLGKISSYTQPTVNKVYDYIYGDYDESETSNDINKISEIVPGVYISSFASACYIDKLKDLGITHIVSVLAGVEKMYPEDFKYCVIDVCDRSYSDIDKYFDECSLFIDECVKSSGKVLVHCKYGVSRSATIVGAYLISKRGESTSQAIKIMKERRNCVNPNQGFIDQLLKYESSHNNNDSSV